MIQYVEFTKTECYF
uniref:Uncharacterized protein n=1 Tax=Anguilla anguilla TaxID=7936 RepID=A0A0E9UV18_ANGAN